MAYIGSSQQIFETTVYGLGGWFPVAFGLVAIAMGIAAFVNSQLVRRLGMRRLAHAGIAGFAIVALLQLAAAFAFDGRPPLLLFGLLLAGCQFLFSICMPNFNALAMEPLGAIAGTASSFIGFYTTLLGALAGLAVGLSFDGTVLPLALGYFVLGTASLLIVLVTERGRLSLARDHEPAEG